MKKSVKTLKSKYQYVGFLPESVRIKDNGYWGMNDYDGNEILPSNFIEVFTLSSGQGLIAARDAGFWDIYDYKGNKLNRNRYDYIYPYYGFFGLSKVKIGDSWGLLSKFGNVIIPVEYQKIEKFGKGLCLYKENEINFIERDQLIKLSTVKNYKYKKELRGSISKSVMGITPRKTSTA
jgi:hypothetical protein